MPSSDRSAVLVSIPHLRSRKAFPCFTAHAKEIPHSEFLWFKEKLFAVSAFLEDGNTVRTEPVILL